MLFKLENDWDLSEGLQILLTERGHRLLKQGDSADAGRDDEMITIYPEKLSCIPYEETLQRDSVGDETLSGELLQDKLCTEKIFINGIRIRYCRKTHFFRGFMKILMYLEKNTNRNNLEYSFREKVWFTSNGGMYDCSRNGVLKVETIKRLIRRMASLGLNTLMLYTEETYELENYPYFGAYRGRYTVKEWKECDDYADLFGVELIPCIQTLAHLHTALRWNVFAELKDTPDILLVDKEEVYDLIEEMIRTLSTCLRSRQIHLGMDEAHELGLGRFLNEHGYQDRFAIMNRHLDRVCSICRKYGMQPRIWSDMYFRLCSPQGDYYDLEPGAGLEGVARPPEGVRLIYWDYYHGRKEHYNHYFSMHRRLSSQVGFAGGAWTWNGVAPNYSKMYRTTRSALQACRESGVRDVVCTFWQDNGAETPMEAGNPALVLFAENGFLSAQDQAHVQDKAMEEWTEFLWGAPLSAWELLDRFDCTDASLPDNMEADNPSKFLLYQDMLTGLFDGQIRGMSLGKHYEALEKELEEYLSAHPEASPLFSYYHTLAKLLTVKAELGITIYDAYHRQDRETLLKAAAQTLPLCRRLAEELARRRRKLWFAECKPFGWEVLDIRINGVAARCESVRERLVEYLEGTVDSLPELEEPRLVYAPDAAHPEHRLLSCNQWEYIVSAGNIAGI